MTLKISQLTQVVAGSLDGTEPVELGIPGDKNAPNGAFLPPGYIDGLKMQWVGPQAITVTSGAAYVPSLGRVIRVPNAIALAGLVLAASTWYHLYLYSNAGVPAIECVTTAPASAYNGTARAKTGDTSRRYVGSVLTDASGNIVNFIQSGNHVAYRVVGGVAPFRLVAGANNTATATANASSVVPVTSFNATVQLYNFDNAGGSNMGTGTSDATGTGAGNNGICLVRAQATAFVQHPLDSAQSLTYWFSAPPLGTTGMFIDLFGYLYER